MNRGLDFEKAQAAFKRAAEKAIHGTREERSGRFETTQWRRASDTRGERIRDTRVGDLALVLRAESSLYRF
jgi:hypothetical protein